MSFSFLRGVAAALSLATAALATQAGVTEIPGTDGVQSLIGANARGDLLWHPSGFGLRLSTRDAAGTYTHTAIDATVAGKGWFYSQLAANGDAVWMGMEPGNVLNIFHWDATTRTARALTTGPSSRIHWPHIGGNGNATWPQFVPLCTGCADGGYHVNYFDKASGVITRLTAAPRAAIGFAMNHRGDAWWFERASDNVWELRRYDALARLISVVTRRPAGTRPSGLRTNDFGDATWVEYAEATGRYDVHLADQRSASVMRITDNPAEESDLRINAVGDLAWRAGPELHTYNRRTGQTTLVSNRAPYTGDFAFNELGELAWTKAPSDYIREMHYYKRADGSDVRVRPSQPYPMEIQPALTPSGEVFYVTASGMDWLQRRIVRATRDFNPQ